MADPHVQAVPPKGKHPATIGTAAAESEPAYDPTNPQSGRALVNFHLRQLGLGEVLVKTENDWWDYKQPERLGCCRAYVLTEAAWPEDVELCVLVSWSPDVALRRIPRTGEAPPGAEKHWRERLAATADALESLGYVVERNGPPRSPHCHSEAELLVYRMASGVAPVRLPAGAWAGAEPNPPHHQRRSWYPDPDPAHVIGAVLYEARLLSPLRYTRHSTPSGENGYCVVRSITQTVWPPHAEVCAWVLWWPADEFKRSRESGGVPPGADEHWTKQTAHVSEVLQQAGFTVRRRARPFDPATDEYADFLVYRARP